MHACKDDIGIPPSSPILMFIVVFVLFVMTLAKTSYSATPQDQFCWHRVCDFFLVTNDQVIVSLEGSMEATCTCQPYTSSSARAPVLGGLLAISSPRISSFPLSCLLIRLQEIFLRVAWLTAHSSWSISYSVRNGCDLHRISGWGGKRKAASGFFSPF